MNRVILIGNGFDLAHGLKTSYKDFIDDFWNKKTDLVKEIFRKKSILGVVSNDPLVETQSGYIYNDNEIKLDIANLGYFPRFTEVSQSSLGYDGFSSFISRYRINEHNSNLHFNNRFLGRITLKKQIKHWLDIEEEYYLALNECLHEGYEGGIEQLNSDFSVIKTLLENYLKKQTANKINKLAQIEQNINSNFSSKNILKEPKIPVLYETLYLSFNYTNTEKLYVQNNNSDKIIHIHGELNSPENPIIFGYGDDIDEKYKLIEQEKDYRYLENIKSIRYLETRNYQEMLKFIDADEYTIYIMGLSCSNSDRTLLNTLFEHKNCLSIKVFYHQREDGTNDYSDIIKNISRNFTDKPLFRKIVVDKTLCVPLS